jgi:phenylpropionate dioxygenase-like ring-hydroxylating dioxygenase large terminal subunit
LKTATGKKGMRAVGEVRNYRGFIFCRLAETGISFEDFFGESLSSIDNMVDRSPAGGSRLPGRRSLHASLQLENAGREPDRHLPSDGGA